MVYTKLIAVHEPLGLMMWHSPDGDRYAVVSPVGVTADLTEASARALFDIFLMRARRLKLIK